MNNKTPLTDLFRKYFQLSEFDSPDEPGSGKSMDFDFLNKLAIARDYADTPFIINSGFRTIQHNKNLIARGFKASKNSTHTLGIAVDISAKTDRQRFLILNALFRVGFQRIGISETFIHVDDDKQKTRNVAWMY